MELLGLPGWTNGSSLFATVDAATSWRPVSRAKHGIGIRSLSLHGPYPFDACWNYLLPQTIGQAARDLRMPSVRIYEGIEDRNKLGSRSEHSDKLAYSLSRIHVSPEDCIFCLSYCDPSSEVPPNE